MALDSKKNSLTNVSLSGVLAPCRPSLNQEQNLNYRLLGYSGLEYFLISDKEWRETLSRYSWQEVKIVGLLNISNKTLIPQKIYPKGPIAAKMNQNQPAVLSGKKIFKNFIKDLNHHIVLPLSVLAIMISLI